MRQLILLSIVTLFAISIQAEESTKFPGFNQKKFERDLEEYISQVGHQIWQLNIPDVYGKVATLQSRIPNLVSVIHNQYIDVKNYNQDTVTLNANWETFSQELERVENATKNIELLTNKAKNRKKATLSKIRAMVSDMHNLKTQYDTLKNGLNGMKNKIGMLDAGESFVADFSILSELHDKVDNEIQSSGLEREAKISALTMKLMKIAMDSAFDTTIDQLTEDFNVIKGKLLTINKVVRMVSKKSS